MPEAPAHPARLAVMLSGSGRTLVNIAKCIHEGTLNATIPLVIASRPCLGADRARELGIECIILPGVIPAEQFDAVLHVHRIDYIALAGYLKLLDLSPAWEKRVVNIHPALLPSFGGKGMFGHHVHEAVLAARCKISGCTVHFCDREFDTGAIILQRTCPVLDTDTPETLAARVFEQECIAYPEALRLLIAGRILSKDGHTRILPANTIHA